MNLFAEPTPASTATFSDCGMYRYKLTRTWNPELPPVCFCMLNPSTATAEQDDPTIRRCINFAKLWGHGGLIVVNLFALRSTDPAALYSHPNPIAPPYPIDCNPAASLRVNANSSHIMRVASTCDRVIAAWGVHGAFKGRGNQVVTIVSNARMGKLECLGVTKDGHPRHPLYIAANTKPVVYGGARP